MGKRDTPETPSGFTLIPVQNFESFSLCFLNTSRVQTQPITVLRVKKFHLKNWMENGHFSQQTNVLKISISFEIFQFVREKTKPENPQIWRAGEGYCQTSSTHYIT
ncbi:frizzled-5 [Platysternon megacephalum]|uniref:Frizzled-5 n=1 Tax=Platysternon megacephalum TaxID=55544 RepID=A0A4D9F324_9SAUR|nr:frizzled-5 [Platysternon megacephalum]